MGRARERERGCIDYRARAAILALAESVAYLSLSLFLALTERLFVVAVSGREGR